MRELTDNMAAFGYPRFVGSGQQPSLGDLASNQERLSLKDKSGVRPPS